MVYLNQQDLDAFKADRTERLRLEAIINTPELIDFPKAVMLEAQHQEARWGTEDREGKAPADWFRLIGHLSTRALEHHKEAERLVLMAAHHYPGFDGKNLETIPAELMRHSIAFHREKAVHHTITTAAALAHWHASIVGKHTAMRPGSATPAELQEATAC